MLYSFHELETTLEYDEIINDERSEFVLEFKERDVKKEFLRWKEEQKRESRTYFAGSKQRKEHERCLEQYGSNQWIFMSEWHNYDYIHGIGWGRFTNPNDKWDWYNYRNEDDGSSPFGFDRSMRWNDTFIGRDGTKSNRMLKKDITKFNYDNFAYGSKYPPCICIKLDDEIKWVEMGKVGWFGVMLDPVCDEWENYFEKLWEKIPDDTMITAVDCHI